MAYHGAKGSMTFRDNNDDHHGDTKVDNDNSEINEVNPVNNNREHKSAISTSDDGNNIDTKIIRRMRAREIDMELQRSHRQIQCN
jgi:hypothetical protein